MGAGNDVEGVGEGKGSFGGMQREHTMFLAYARRLAWEAYLSAWIGWKETVEKYHTQLCSRCAESIRVPHGLGVFSERFFHGPL